jgi:hypothetical protein
MRDCPIQCEINRVHNSVPMSCLCRWPIRERTPMNNTEHRRSTNNDFYNVHYHTEWSGLFKWERYKYMRSKKVTVAANTCREQNKTNEPNVRYQYNTAPPKPPSFSLHVHPSPHDSKNSFDMSANAAWPTPSSPSWTIHAAVCLYNVSRAG